MNNKIKWIFHPFLFAIFPVLALFSVNIGELSPDTIFIYIGITVGVTSIIFVTIGLILKNFIKTGLIVSLGLILFFSYGHLLNLLNDVLIDEWKGFIHFIVMIGYIISFIFGSYIFIRTKTDLRNANTITNVISAVTILVVLSNIGFFTFTSSSFIENYSLDNNKLTPVEKIENLPNIYYIVLDGYARSDILKKEFNYDNDKFLNFLKQKGFFVTENGYSNYPITAISLGSSLNMEYVNYLSTRYGEDYPHLGPYYQLIIENKVVNNLKKHGYSIVNFNSGWGPTVSLENADYNLCLDGELAQEFSILLQSTTMLRLILKSEWEDDLRNRILCVFSDIPILHKKVEKPFFALIHILIPHPPYIFDKDGEYVIPRELILSDTWWLDKEGYVNQLAFTNKKIEEIIDKLFNEESERQSVIIIQSDHGPEILMNWDNPSVEALEERMSILNAYYIPSIKTESLYHDITPVNTFRIVFNTYFNTDYQLLENKIFFANNKNERYKFYEITDLFSTNLIKINLQGTNLQNNNLTYSDFRHYNLVYLNFSGSDLSHSSFYGADVHGTDFSNANLTNVRLIRVDLSSSILFDTILTGSNLANSDLSGVDLSGKDLRGVVLRGANLTHANLSGADLSDADMSGAILRYAKLYDTNLENSNLANSDLSGVDLSGKDLKGVVLRGANLTHANLSGADLSDADITKLFLKETMLDNVDLTFKDFSETYFISIDFIGKDLTGSNFTKAYLAGSDLRDTILENVIFTRTNLTNANLAGNQHLSNTRFYVADLSNAILVGANLANLYFRGSDLTDADLSYADLSDSNVSIVDFNRANLNKTKIQNLIFQEGCYNHPICN